MPREQAERWREVLEPEPLRASYQVRNGVSVTLIIVLTGLVFWLFSKFTAIRPYVPHTSAALGLLAVALYFLQRQEPEENLGEEYVLHFFLRPRYWSFILLISTGLIFALCSTLLVAEKVEARPEPKPVVQPPIVTPVEEPAPAAQPDAFPSLNVAGVLVNGARSSAVINGRTILLGEYTEGVKLVEVAEDGVVVEWKGEQRDVALTPVSGGSNQR